MAARAIITTIRHGLQKGIQEDGIGSYGITNIVGQIVLRGNLDATRHFRRRKNLDTDQTARSL